MKAQELRIGNYVEHEDPNETVEGIHYSNVDEYRILIGSYLRPIEDLKPIPLTVEWLLKFGFKKESQVANHSVFANYTKGEYSVHVVFDINQFNFVNCVQTGDVFPTRWALGAIKDVHQLQNIYFALTNEELK